MKHTFLIRLGGLAAMVGNAIYAVNGIGDWRQEAYLRVFGFLFLLSVMAALVAIHLLNRERERYGLRGTRAFFAAFVGVALVLGGSFLSESFPALAEIGNLLFLTGELLFLVGVLVATVGIIRLAVVTLNVEVLPRWGGLALLAGNPLLALGMLIFFYGGDPSIWFWLVALPWITVGLAVFLVAGRQIEQAARVR